MTPLAVRVAAAAVLLLAAWAAPAAGIVTLSSERVVLEIDLRGGLPRSWSACALPCVTNARRMNFVAAGGGERLRWNGPPALAGELARREYVAVTRDTPEVMVVELRAVAAGAAAPPAITWTLSRLTHEVRLRAMVPPGTGLLAVPAAGFTPPVQPGFSGIYGETERVVLAPDGGLLWSGMRSRFWAWLGQPELPGRAVVPAPVAGRGVLWQSADNGLLVMRFYAGPIEWSSLRVVSPALSDLLFANLWAPLRWLAFGLLFLLGALGRVIPQPGLAIIALSLCVKVILYPLTHIAERWQSEVNRIQARIAPQVAAIRRDFRGEEAHNRTLEVYRAEGVSPWFTVRSLAGFVIQVPMFIAAFDMLAGNFSLAGVPFLWIADLAAPDRFAALPFTLPFFGSHLNLLPVLMTTLTVLSAIIQQDAHLPPPLLHRQRRQLFLMAAFFFLLFYTFPAGMVLYWTANNGWHLLKLLARRLAASGNAA